MSIPEHLEATVKNLPALPGCYLFYDQRGEVIYVGKAVNLRSRVRSYFNLNTWAASPKTARLVKEIARIEVVVRGNELEALIQEAELIKKHRPRYNIRLKDDKRYPYLKVTWQDDFPTVVVTRRIERDGARYYGPYSSAKAVYATRDALRKMFPFLSCDRVITGHDTRACLYYDIKLCSGPCIGAINRAEYRANIQRLCDFLEGKSDQVIADVRARMEAAARALQFERAAEYRDQLRALEHVVEKQRVISSAGSDQDVIAFARDEGETCVQVLFIRGGKLLGQEYFVLDGAEGEDDQAVLDAFLKRFYDEAAYVPPEVLLPAQVEEAHIIERWLRQKRGAAVQIRPPQGEADISLIELARQNAQQQLAILKAQWREDTLRQEAVLRELQEALDLPRPPTRIECYDVSNTQGTAVVGSMVVFVHGVPKKSDYRRFNIREIAGPNDFESLRQMLRRRFQRWRDAQARSDERPAPGKRQDLSWAILPDLVLIDGGKGQLNVAVEVLREFDLAHIVPVAALAKQKEEIFLPDREASILLPRDAQAFYLVQRIRDEAHRFGLAGHRRQREKIGLASQLDALPGVGPARRRKLLAAFGSLEGIRAADVEALSKVVPRKVAEAIKDGLGAG
ncbi:MAG: excinuclease ABC subunit UvrC [Chloroflexi bacterium]|jgi:excinuclease ABC subunit C|nr:excinuclease ABC subunit UvrC [Chloroflexota bacterium]